MLKRMTEPRFELQLDPGKTLSKPHNRFGQQIYSEGGASADCQTPSGEPLQIVELRLGLVHQSEDLPRVGRKDLSLTGQSHAAMHSLE